MSLSMRSETLTALKTAGLNDQAIASLSKVVIAPRTGSSTLTQLGFNAAAVAKLPTDAQHLTKDDLMSLGGWGTSKLTPAAAKLSASDVAAIKNVLGSSLHGGLGGNIAADINCCCCPCCCATAVTAKKSIRKANAVMVGQ
jgi:hypothetical protein